MKTPPPTWCPECRAQRRMIWRNERSLYKRKCDVSGHTEDIISIYSPDREMVVYDRSYWKSDAWNPLDSGQEYDFQRPFFAQLDRLLHRVPLIALFNENTVNSEYTNHVFEMKNCYLVFGAWLDENVHYSSKVGQSRECMDVTGCTSLEQAYEDTFCSRSYDLKFSYQSSDCVSSALLYNCRNCEYCFLSTNLRNKKYCIFNKPYSKEAYLEKLKEFDLGSYTTVQRLREELRKLDLFSVHRFAAIEKSVNVTGDNLSEAKNCLYCFDFSQRIEDSKYIVHGALDFKDSYDGYGVGMGELHYEVVDSGIQASRVAFGVVVYSSHDVFYSINCKSCHHLFACIGLRNKQYCILNKQYTKEEYEALVPQIIAHMNEMPYTDAQGRVYRYGEFFPPELSPFAYNETIAQEYFPLTKDQVRERGYHWRDPDPKAYTITKKPDDLPDHIRDIKDSILQETIGCSHEGKCQEQCTTAFRIIPQELVFYRSQNLSLPRLCPNCRHYERLKQRNPLKLWHRKCTCGGMKSENGIYQNQASHFHSGSRCPNEFETSYSPERKEIIYCEACYQSEVV